MSEELLVNVTPQETRVAVVENGVLQEMVVERQHSRGLVGNIYRGKVVRVLPGMQAAFLEIGEARTAFLHVSELLENCHRNHSEADVNRTTEISIEQLITEGQNLLVQVTKDPMGSKGARLTTHIAIPSRYLVFMPNNQTIGISQRIEDEEERNRLRSIIQEMMPDMQRCADEEDSIPEENQGGFIARTAAESIAADDIQNDMNFLRRLWCSLKYKMSQSEAIGIVYEDLPLSLRIMRDMVEEGIEKIRIDSKESYQKVFAFTEKFVPTFVSRIQHYPGERPIMDLYSIEDEIQRALDRKVDLKSGGHIVIDQTEAMTTIDVNTGAFVGHRNLGDTIFKTNLEAAQSIARQLRLRNLGGIIIIDFIDMSDTEHQRQVLRALEKALERDHAKTSISEITSLGLVEMTRKRTRESLEHILCEPCSTCNTRGTIKTAETVSYEIMRDILREARQFDAQKMLVIASISVVDRLLDEESTSIAELEDFIQRPIQIQPEVRYAQEQYDVVLL